ncbi:MAG: hypothetical protein U1E63_11360 [Burkholderiales bacterium]
MGLPKLSVLDMERMALGEDVRNAPQRPAGAENEHLSQSRDEVIADLAGAMGLAAANPVNKEEVLEALAALPTTRSVQVRPELHPYLAALAGCLLLASLIPERSRAGLRRSAFPAGSDSARARTREVFARRDPRAQLSPSIDIYRGPSALRQWLAFEMYCDLSLLCMRSLGRKRANCSCRST